MSPTWAIRPWSPWGASTTPRDPRLIQTWRQEYDDLPQDPWRQDVAVQQQIDSFYEGAGALGRPAVAAGDREPADEDEAHPGQDHPGGIHQVPGVAPMRQASGRRKIVRNSSSFHASYYKRCRRSSHESGTHTHRDHLGRQAQGDSADPERSSGEPAQASRQGNPSRGRRGRPDLPDNACKKALTMARHFHMPVMAEDSGLEVDCLGGRPGVYSQAILRTRGDRRGEQPQAAGRAGRNARGAAHREIPMRGGAGHSRRGAHHSRRGRARDASPRRRWERAGSVTTRFSSIRLSDKTFGQVDARLKNQVSHRAKALRLFRERLAELLKTQPQSPSAE